MRKMAKALMVVSIVFLAGGISFAKEHSNKGVFRFALKFGDFRISNFDRLGKTGHPRVEKQYVFNDNWKTYCRLNAMQHYRSHRWQDCSCPFCSNYRNHHNKKNSKKARIDSLAKVISADADQNESSPGILLKTVSKEFLEHFNQDDLVIAKGQGNYESLNEVKREIFFLLLVKCPLVAQDMDTKMGDLIFRVQK